MEDINIWVCGVDAGMWGYEVGEGMVMDSSITSISVIMPPNEDTKRPREEALSSSVDVTVSLVTTIMRLHSQLSATFLEYPTWW